jgi:hypothetical protein
MKCLQVQKRFIIEKMKPYKKVGGTYTWCAVLEYLNKGKWKFINMAVETSSAKALRSMVNYDKQLRNLSIEKGISHEELPF